MPDRVSRSLQRLVDCFGTEGSVVVRTKQLSALDHDANKASKVNLRLVWS